MQKITLACTYLFLLVSFSVLSAQAQPPRIGIKLGTAIANCSINSTEPVIDASAKATVTVGLFTQIPLRKRFSIRTGLEYVSKGSMINKTFNYYYVYSMREHIRFNYLDIPVNLLYDIPLRLNKLFVGCGPVIGFLLNKKANRGVAGTDIGANIQAGFEWPVGVAFIVNYTQGFRNISAGHYNETSIRNHYTGITLAYWF